MRRLAVLLAVALAFPASADGWAKASQGWAKISQGGSGSYATIPSPTGCTSGMVPYFNSSLQLVCSPTVYAHATDTTTATGTVAARNLTATALATPVITPPVSPVLSLLTTVTVVAGASLADGDYFTLSDGSAVVYEFDNDATVTPGRVGITFVGDETAQAIRDLVVVAINGSTLEATAIAAAADTLTVTSDTAGDTMGVNSENVADAGFLVPAWSEPTHATTYGYKVEACLADGSCAPSAEVQTTTGHATLSNANYNSVTWGAVTGAAYYKLTRVTGTPAGGDAPPRLLYTGALLNFSDTNATSTSEAVATFNETGRLTSSALTAGRVPIVGTGGRVEDDAGLTYDTVNNNYRFGKNALANVTINPGPSGDPGVSGFGLLAFGPDAMRYGVLTYESTAFGNQAMKGDAGGWNGRWNTAFGNQTLYNLDGGDLNVALGEAALFNTTSGTENTAAGGDVMGGNTTGTGNSAFGSAALFGNITGSFNTAIGWKAGYFREDNYGLYLGAEAGKFPGVPQAQSDDQQIHIGSLHPENPFIFGDTEANLFYLRGDTVIVNTSDGTITPNARAGAEVFNTTVGWPPWSVTGDFAIAGGAATYTHSTGGGTLIASVFTTPMVAGEWYQFSYTIASRTGDEQYVSAYITNAAADTFTRIPVQNGSYTVRFRASSNPTNNFGVSVASTGAVSFVLSVPSVKRMLGGTLHVNRSVRTPVLLGSQAKALTDATPTAFATFTIADGEQWSGEIIYAVRSVDGTNKQITKGRVQFTASREGTDYDFDVSEIGTPVVSAKTGTLTGAISIDCTGGVCTLSANFNSSQTTPVLTGSFRFDSTDAGLALSFP